LGQGSRGKYPYFWTNPKGKKGKGNGIAVRNAHCHTGTGTHMPNFPTTQLQVEGNLYAKNQLDPCSRFDTMIIIIIIKNVLI